jgi:methionyl-tRNA synthetase
MRARYLTTTLPYVNASPHLGFALEAIQADALARSWREAGDTVFFSMGTDEHGQKIFEAAEKAGEKTQLYVDRYAEEFQKLKELLNLSNNVFIRTTSAAHVSAAQEMWRRCSGAGDIYKKSYTGLYCVGCESFKTEKEVVDGHCSIHTHLELQEVTEENYFFQFSNYQEKLLAYLKRADSIIPEWRRAEAIAFVEGGLEDFSISREKKRISWGIPVPGDDSQVMYVWFDALTNYISTLGWPEDAEGNFNKFWEEGETLQVAGKDQIRFQSLMWQAMLMSAEIKNTDHVFYHGFINSGGQKMSKSLGNVLSPYDLVAKYGTDAVRYVLLRHVSPTEDSDLTLDAIHEHYTAHLTNGLGNLVARVMKLCEDNLDAPITPPEKIKEREDITKKLAEFAFNGALDDIFSLITAADERITKEEPFKIVKSDPVRGKAILSELAAEVWKIGHFLSPFMPSTSEKIVKAVQENKKPENLFPRL